MKTRKMEDPRIQFISGLVGYAVQRNIDAEQLCRLAGIDKRTLEKRQTITTSQEEKLWLTAMNLSNDSLFGLHFGESLQLAALGVVGQIIQMSNTVGEALQHAVSFAHLVNDSISIKILNTGKEFTLHFNPASSSSKSKEVLQQLIHLFMVFSMHELDGLLLKKLQPISVTLTEVPSDIEEYRRVFRDAPIKKGKSYSLSFPKPLWNEPILSANYDLQYLLLKRVAGLQKKTNTAALQVKIYNHLLTNAYLGIPTLEAMAANLNTSARSLQRKLQEEGTSYQLIADAVRKSLAIYYLQSGNHALKEISYILGYNELSAFTRAFKRWTGTPPAQYQKA